MGVNELERQRWNDERRYAMWPKRERLTDAVTGMLLDAVAPADGERILDIGSGGGRTAMAAGKRVGESGTVVGADISAALCRLAEERATAAGATNVTFTLADAQTDSLPGGPFDAAMSQFGVMFFDGPVTAFGNIRAHLRPRGRLVFACWQSSDANPWFPARAVADFVPPAPEPEPGKSPTGPFSLADPARTAEILEAAGFTEVRSVPHELAVEAGEDSVLDQAQLELMGIATGDLPAALEVARQYLSRFSIGGELFRFPLAFQIVSAASP